MQNIKRYFAFFLFPFTAIAATQTSITEKFRAPESDLNFSVDIQYAAIQYPKYKFNSSVLNTETGHGVQIAFEWLPIQSFGKWGVGIGTAGVFGISDISLGNGRFASLRLLPLDAFLSFRLELTRRQLLVPFARWGVNHTLVEQTSQTGGGRPGTQVYRGWIWSAGLQLCLSNLDKTASRTLDRNVGINSVYLQLEYKTTQSWETNPEMNLDLRAYLAGLHFEF